MGFSPVPGPIEAHHLTNERQLSGGRGVAAVLPRGNSHAFAPNGRRGDSLPQVARGSVRRRQVGASSPLPTR
jgi:hypothetical protein